MTHLRTIAVTAAALGAVALLTAVVAADPALWASWPGAVVRYCGSCILAVGLYALAGRIDRRAARRCPSAGGAGGVTAAAAAVGDR